MTATMAMFTGITHQNTPEGRRDGNYLPEGRQENRSTEDSTLKSVFSFTMHAHVIVHSILCPCSFEYQGISQQSLSPSNALGRGFPCPRVALLQSAPQTPISMSDVGYFRDLSLALD